MPTSMLALPWLMFAGADGSFQAQVIGEQVMYDRELPSDGRLRMLPYRNAPARPTTHKTRREKGQTEPNPPGLVEHQSSVA
jgi:hypothetical protein